MNTTAKIAVGVAALLTLPVFGMAAERSITVSSLNSAYKSQAAALDGKIASDQAFLGKQKTVQGEYANQKAVDTANDLTQAKHDRQELDLIYGLLNASLQ